MPDPFSTVYGQEWFVDTDANLVITDQGVFPLEVAVAGVISVGFATETEAAQAVAVVLELQFIVVVTATETEVAESVTALFTDVFVGWGSSI